MENGSYFIRSILTLSSASRALGHTVLKISLGTIKNSVFSRVTMVADRCEFIRSKASSYREKKRRTVRYFHKITVLYVNAERKN